MGSVNVNRNVTDIFYRYKMPRIAAKVEGKGNGIKTVIVNMVEVAKAIGRPATYTTKYFGCELGAQTQFDHKVCVHFIRHIHIIHVYVVCHVWMKSIQISKFAYFNIIFFFHFFIYFQNLLFYELSLLSIWNYRMNDTL